MAYDDGSPYTVHSNTKEFEQAVGAPREMTIEEELEGLARMLDEYQTLTENIEQTKRRLQEKFDMSSNRLSKLFEHQELIKRGEYAVSAESSAPTRGRF